MEIERRLLKFPDFELHYRVAGQGRPVVLVHGLSGSGHWWRQTIPALAKHYRVFALDLAGFGHSHAASFELREASRQLLTFLDVLKLDKPTLVGHSMGGFIVADLTARHPERVERLVLVDAAALPFEEGVFGRGIGLALAAWYMPKTFWPVFLNDAYRAGPRTLWQATNDLLAADIARDLDRIEAETLVVWGQHDRLVPLSLGKELSRRLRHSRLEIIAGAAHSPMLEQPQEFNRLLLDFLKGSAGA